MRILLVEDDEALAMDVAGGLRLLGWSVQWQRSGERFADLLDPLRFDAALLDIGLPGVDGFGALAQARARGRALPVLMLTARDAIEDRVRGLEGGADDYLVKPFALAELVARLRALVRRHRPADVLEHGPLRLDAQAKRAWLEDAPLELSRREWLVLEQLMTHAERVVGKDTLVAALTIDQAAVSVNAIEVYVCRLRAKLEPAGVQIRTVRGFGYMLDRRSLPMRDVARA